MLRLRLLPDFRLADGEGREQPFDDFLADYNVIMLTHVAEGTHKPAADLLRALVAEGRGVEGVPVRGFDIRSLDGFCDRSCGPHIVFQGREFVTICDSGG
ncbi:MAG: hypothetical protein ACE5HE_00545 [Phycisphaerae bacterium]